LLRLTLPWIWNHPLASTNRVAGYRRYGWWQLRRRLDPTPWAMPWVNGTRLLLEPAMTGATGNWYVGLHEWPDMAFVLHLLRPTDTFADIGANVGSYTVLASGAIGCHTEAFEPVPGTYERLCRNLELNDIRGRVCAHQMAVGAAEGSLRFSIDCDAENQAVDASYPGQAIGVLVRPVDALPELANTCCWKLDVEGHESALLAGAERALRDAPPAVVLCEDRSEAVARTFTAAGYLSCAYDPWSRRLEQGCHSQGSNQLWIRDLAWVSERLRSAPAFVLLGQKI
jgi:FkbM family methyltransferase